MAFDTPFKIGRSYHDTRDHVEQPGNENLASDDSLVLHILEWSNRSSDKTHQLKSEKPFDLSHVPTKDFIEPDPVEDEECEAAFHVIRHVDLWEATTFEQIQKEKTDSEAANQAQARDGVKENVTLKDLHISYYSPQKIQVISETLIKAIRHCVEYYPYHVDRFPPYCDEPYQLFVYYLKELREFSEQAHVSPLKRRHVAALVKYLESYMEPRITPLLERLQLPKPTITYDDLWMLFKPGTEVYWRFGLPHFSHIISASVVIRIEDYLPRHHPNFETQTLVVEFWALATDGEKLGRDEGSITIEKFEGERLVTSLSVYPCAIADREDGGATRRSLIARGKRTFDVMKKMPLQMWHDGYWFSEQKNLDQSPCVIDVRTAGANMEVDGGLDERRLLFLEHEITSESRYTDMYLWTEGNKFKFADFPTIRIAESEQLPSETHYLLCQPMLAGYNLYHKSYKIYYVENLEVVNPNDVMGDLVIDSANNDLIMAMSHAHFQPINLDTIHNKGEGQVILLHGPPGVGKTFTVECIATTTGRPLIALTLGDLLAEESKVEETLLNWFTLAERWKAVLLLDEADIFLERRASKDIQRNGIVSMFLRRMEYFRGTLFLTTNRVGQIDDAFLSRVSVVLQYDRLSDDTRKRIWQGFFRKLRKSTSLSNGRKVEVDKYAEKYVLNDPVVRDLSWNGREIRNALQTAIHLASYRGLMNGDRAEETVDVGTEHFESVVAMSLKFKDYMQSITGQDEDERAKARSERSNIQQ